MLIHKTIMVALERQTEERFMMLDVISVMWVTRKIEKYSCDNYRLEDCSPKYCR